MLVNVRKHPCATNRTPSAGRRHCSVDRVQLLPTYSEEISNPMPVAFFISAVKLSCYGDEKEQTLSFAPYFMDHSHFAAGALLLGDCPF